MQITKQELIKAIEDFNETFKTNLVLVNNVLENDNEQFRRFVVSGTKTEIFNFLCGMRYAMNLKK